MLYLILIMECFAMWPFPHPHDTYLWLNLWKRIKIIMMLWWWQKQYWFDISMQTIWLQHSVNYGRTYGSIFRDNMFLSYCSSIIPKTIQTQLHLSLKQSCFHKHLLHVLINNVITWQRCYTNMQRKANQYWKLSHLYILLSY